MKAWAGRLLLLVTGIVVSMCLAELFLRVFHPQPLNVLYVRPDGILSHVPGIDATVVSLETRARVRINRDGLRDVERPRGKPPGIARVIVLGDSMIEGLQVELGETMPKRLEGFLSQALPGRGIDVINAGVSGSSGPDDLAWLEKEGFTFGPDVVVVTFTARNDIDDAADARERKRSRFYEAKSFLRSRFHLYVLLERALDTEAWLRDAIAAFGIVEPADRLRIQARANLANAVNREAWYYDGRLDEKEARGYDRLFASWNRILTLCRARGVPVMFVLLPSYFQVTQDPSALGNPRWVVEMVRNDRESQDRAMAFLKPRGAVVVDLLPEARRRGKGLYLLRDQHFSAAGNAFAAQETAQAILAQGWLSRGR